MRWKDNIDKMLSWNNFYMIVLLETHCKVQRATPAIAVSKTYFACKLNGDNEENEKLISSQNNENMKISLKIMEAEFQNFHD